MFTPVHSPRHTVPFKLPRFLLPYLHSAIGSVLSSSWWWGPKERTRKSELSWTPWWTRPQRSPAWRRMEDRPLRNNKNYKNWQTLHFHIKWLWWTSWVNFCLKDLKTICSWNFLRVDWMSNFRNVTCLRRMRLGLEFNPETIEQGLILSIENWLDRQKSLFCTRKEPELKFG